MHLIVLGPVDLCLFMRARVPDSLTVFFGVLEKTRAALANAKSRWDRSSGSLSMRRFVVEPSHGARLFVVELIESWSLWLAEFVLSMPVILTQTSD
jgi:hypothetical protein